jgi:hypothetical protein
MIVALAALFVALGGVGVAATGGTFILGQSNSANNTSALASGVTTGPTFELSNSGGKPAARFNTPSGVQPFVVNNPTKVQNLNAEKVDGFDSAHFLPKTGKAADSDKLDGIDSGGFVPAAVVRRVGPITVLASNPPAPVTIAVVGQLTFRGSCIHFADDNERSDLEIVSSLAHSAYSAFSQSGSVTYGEPDMNAGQPYFLGTLFLSPGGQPAFKAATGEALSADGHQISFDLYQGQNVRGQTGKCVFGGTFVVN